MATTPVVSVTTSATLIASGVGSYTIRNDAALGGTDVFIGEDNTVASNNTNGFRLQPQASISVDLGRGDTVYGIVASGTVTVQVFSTRKA